jgi:hypothetical protein
MNRVWTPLLAELAPFPGRANVMLRCLLTSTIVMVLSMALEIPFLALSLLVVFYLTQANVDHAAGGSRVSSWRITGRWHRTVAVEDHL